MTAPVKRFLDVADVQAELGYSRAEAYRIMHQMARLVDGRKLRVERKSFERWRRRSGRCQTGWIYMVQAGIGGPVKVGFATNVRQRLRSLQTANPLKLKLLARLPGNLQMEARMHRSLRAHHIRGEWFRPCEIVSELSSRGLLR